ncbi:MAG: PilN domain-containing protein [Candidatus Daviesbacteria bacterium]|nr:PilN domain-containing protein [Candidatus Daviesbacteria bacterium]
MATKNTPKLILNLDLLKPQSSPLKLPVKLLKWSLSTGRYIFIVVEGMVLVAFITRFFLDAQLIDKTEKIDQQVQFIKSKTSDEILIRQTQMKLSTINAFYKDLVDYPLILKNIADQTPLNVSISNIFMEKVTGKVNISISAQAQSNNDVSSFVTGLRESQFFSDVRVTGVNLEQNIIRFTVTAQSQNLGEGISL